MNDPILDPFIREMHIQALRYAVGRAMFCPGHSHPIGDSPVLDVRTSVLIGTTVVCGDCWRALSDGERAFILERENPTDPYLDGAALHGADPIIIRPEPAQECDGQEALPLEIEICDDDDPCGHCTPDTRCTGRI